MNNRFSDENQINLLIFGVVLILGPFLIFNGLDSYNYRMKLDGNRTAAFNAGIPPIMLGLVLLVISLVYLAYFLINRWKQSKGREKEISRISRRFQIISFVLFANGVPSLVISGLSLNPFIFNLTRGDQFVPIYLVIFSIFSIFGLGCLYTGRGLLRWITEYNEAWIRAIFILGLSSSVLIVLSYILIPATLRIQSNLLIGMSILVLIITTANVISVLYLVKEKGMYKESREKRKWPDVEGVLESFEIEKREDTVIALISYTVEGIKYTLNDKWMIGRSGEITEEEVHSRYIEKKIIVKYNPKNPREAFIIH